MNKNLMYFALAVMAILSLTVITLPNNAGAYFDSGFHLRTNLDYTPPPDFQSNPAIVNNRTVNNYNSTNYNYSNQSNHSSDSSSSDTTIETANETTATEENNTESRVTTTDFKNLTASAIFGSNSFMPSGLVQWVILAIFILLIILFIRRAFGLDEKYHSTPLKHA